MWFTIACYSQLWWLSNYMWFLLYHLVCVFYGCHFVYFCFDYFRISTTYSMSECISSRQAQSCKSPHPFCIKAPTDQINHVQMTCMEMVTWRKSSRSSFPVFFQLLHLYSLIHVIKSHVDPRNEPEGVLSHFLILFLGWFCGVGMFISILQIRKPRF